jgi:hypothetical protein
LDSALQRIVTCDWTEAVTDESSPATRWWRNALGNGNGSGLTLMQQIQADDIGVDTLPQLLRMEDRSSMAFSLEARVPLLDHKPHSWAFPSGPSEGEPGSKLHAKLRRSHP